MESSYRFSYAIDFETIKFPPFDDILIMARNSPQGKIGLSKAIDLLMPNTFETVETAGEEVVEAVFIHKRILKKISSDRVINILRTKIFPFISEGELVKVDFKLYISTAH